MRRVTSQKKKKRIRRVKKSDDEFESDEGRASQLATPVGAGGNMKGIQHGGHCRDPNTWVADEIEPDKSEDDFTCSDRQQRVEPCPDDDKDDSCPV